MIVESPIVRQVIRPRNYARCHEFTESNISGAYLGAIPCDDCGQLEKRKRFYSEQATNCKREESYARMSAVSDMNFSSDIPLILERIVALATLV